MHKEKQNQSRPLIRTNRKEMQQNIKDKYAQLYNRYVSCDFTYNSHCVIEKLTQNGNQEPHMSGVELYKILVQICKILMLNELEILFFGSTLQEMKWKILENCLTPYLDDFKGLKPDLKSDNYSKKFQLSLLLIAYIVKLYLNEDLSIFESKMREIVKVNYDKMYQEWVEKMRKNFHFSPKNMNKLFQDLQVVHKNENDQELDVVNYNQKVYELFSKLVEDDPKQEEHVGGIVEKKQEENDIDDVEESEQIERAPPSGLMMKNSSIISLRDINPRESFKQILARNHEMENQRMNRNWSNDDFLNE